jgi:hypothetical protein
MEGGTVGIIQPVAGSSGKSSTSVPSGRSVGSLTTSPGFDRSLDGHEGSVALETRPTRRCTRRRPRRSRAAAAAAEAGRCASKRQAATDNS